MAVAARPSALADLSGRNSSRASYVPLRASAPKCVKRIVELRDSRLIRHSDVMCVTAGKGKAGGVALFCDGLTRSRSTVGGQRVAADFRR